MYITSTLARRHMDEQKNVGFVLKFRAGPDGELVRRNTRSLDSGEGGSRSEAKATAPATGRFLAFKALEPRTSVPQSGEAADEGEQEVEMVKGICEEIVQATNKSRGDEMGRLGVEEKDIISLSDAKKSTGYVETLAYSMKKLVWG